MINELPDRDAHAWLTGEVERLNADPLNRGKWAPFVSLSHGWWYGATTHHNAGRPANHAYEGGFVDPWPMNWQTLGAARAWLIERRTPALAFPLGGDSIELGFFADTREYRLVFHPEAVVMHGVRRVEEPGEPIRRFGYETLGADGRALFMNVDNVLSVGHHVWALLPDVAGNQFTLYTVGVDSNGGPFRGTPAVGARS